MVVHDRGAGMKSREDQKRVRQIGVCEQHPSRDAAIGRPRRDKIPDTEHRQIVAALELNDDAETRDRHQQHIKRDDLDGYAKDLNLDMDKWKAALDSQSHKAEVDADAKVGNDAGITGTPAFIINGYFINGAQPFAKFRKLIDRALAEAK